MKVQLLQGFCLHPDVAKLLFSFQLNMSKFAQLNKSNAKSCDVSSFEFMVLKIHHYNNIKYCHIKMLQY